MLALDLLVQKQRRRHLQASARLASSMPVATLRESSQRPRYSYRAQRWSLQSSLDPAFDSLRLAPSSKPSKLSSSGSTVACTRRTLSPLLSLRARANHRETNDLFNLCSKVIVGLCEYCTRRSNGKPFVGGWRVPQGSCTTGGSAVCLVDAQRFKLCGDLDAPEWILAEIGSRRSRSPQRGIVLRPLCCRCDIKNFVSSRQAPRRVKCRRSCALPSRAINALMQDRAERSTGSGD
jgi:hypothetical protein